MGNLRFAKEMSEELSRVRQTFPPEDDFDAFIRASAQLGEKHMSSSGLTMGYSYLDTPLTKSNMNRRVFNPHVYTPRAEPGFFLPHVPTCRLTSIYQKLSPVKWSLLVSDHEYIKWLDGDLCKQNVDIVVLNEAVYLYNYILIRPDWQISAVANTLDGKIADMLNSLNLEVV